MRWTFLSMTMGLQLASALLYIARKYGSLVREACTTREPNCKLPRRRITELPTCHYLPRFRPLSATDVPWPRTLTGRCSK